MTYIGTKKVALTILAAASIIAIPQLAYSTSTSANGCTIYVNQIISGTVSEELENKLNQILPESASGFEPLHVVGIKPCHIIFVEKEALSTRLILTSIHKENVQVISRGQFPEDDSPGSLGTSSLISANKFYFHNKRTVLNLKANYSRGGGGFGASSEDSYYVLWNKDRLSLILQVSDKGGSHYGLTGDCTEYTNHTSTLKLLATRRSSWPDVWQTTNERVQVLCEENNEKKKPIIKRDSSRITQRKFSWDGLGYMNVGADQAIRESPPRR